MPITKGLNGLSKVPEQVPPIGDLYGPRSALTDPVGIGSGTIAGDNLDARPITQPSGNGGSFAIWQEIHHLVRLEVYQHRGSCPGAWCRKVFLSSVGCFVQPTSAGMLTMVSSLSGAMVSSVM